MSGQKETASNLIIKILHQGRNLHTDNAALIINRDKEKKVVGISTYKKIETTDKSLHFARVYSGISVSAAISEYIAATGGELAAIGDAVKFFRDNEATSIIDTVCEVVSDEQ